jgi:hypothetical protein
MFYSEENMKAIMPWLCGLLIFIVSPLTVSAQFAIAGDWVGAIELPGLNLGVVLHFSGTNDSLRATIDIPMQLAQGLPLKNVRFALPVVHFELPAGPGLALFDGTMAGDSITGDFQQGNVSARFFLHRGGKPEAGRTFSRGDSPHRKRGPES